LATVVCLAAGLAGCRKTAVQPEPKSPEEAAFMAADARLAAAKGEAFFGNTPEAKERAEAFATMFKTSLLFASAASKTERSAVEEMKLPTHCEMRGGRVAFLVHVPDLEHASEKAKANLSEVGFLAAKIAMLGLDTETVPVAIGLRGASGYSVVVTGIAEHEAKRDRTGTDGLHTFFAGEPFTGPATMAEFAQAQSDKRTGVDPDAPPMLAGSARAKHPSVGVMRLDLGRTGLAVAVAPRVWVTAQSVLGPIETVEVVDAERRERFIRVVARRGCEVYLQEIGAQHSPTTIARVAAPGGEAFLYGVVDGAPVATTGTIAMIGTGGRGPLMTDLELGARDLGRPLFDAEDRFVGLACNTDPKDSPQLMAVGDVREYLASQRLTDRDPQRPAARAGY
jgi:hypothetical protein